MTDPRTPDEVRELVTRSLHMGLDDVTDVHGWVERVQEWADWLHQQYEPLIVALPASDHTVDAVGDDGQDAISPGWTDSRGGVWIAWTEGVTDPDGNFLDDIEDVRRDALAMLAAVRQVEQWRAEREAQS